MLTETDLLLISGGASVGTHDFTRELLEGLGFSILLAKTPMRPGKPLIVARRDSLLAFGLPGNPLAHFVGLNLFVRAALNRLTAAPCGVPFETATLAEEWSEEPSSRLTLWPARVVRGPAGTQATPLPWTSSGDLTPLATANGLLRFPAYCGSLPRGAALPCFVLPS